MIFPLYFFISFLLIINPIFPLQHYDDTNCTSEPEIPGSNYLCPSKKSSCNTFIIYRAQENYQSLSSISSLFNTTLSHLLSLNNLSQSDPDSLPPGREVIVPITCSCPDRFSKSVYFYNASSSDNLPAIACEVFEGLVKGQSLIQENPGFGTDNNNHGFSLIEVPIKCACPDESDIENGINYLVTYPVIRSDSLYSISSRFRVSEKMIMDANNLNHLKTIYPQTTLLIPMEDSPVLNPDQVSEPDSDPSEPDSNTKGRKSNIFKIIILGVIIIPLVLLIVFGILILVWKKRFRFKNFSSKSTHLSQLSPDLINGMSKLKSILICFSLEEIRVATKGFSKACLVGSNHYRGEIYDSEVCVEEIDSSEAAKSVISILTKINHINIVKIVGFCLESQDFLVYEFVRNGSLRDCLSNSKMAKELAWKKRVQIAIDIAVGLHYMHYCTRPNYIHRNINSKTILITEGYRAKISGFGYARSAICSEENMGKRGDVGPEFLNSGKVDVYAFGIVLMELLFGKEVFKDGILFNDFLKFLDSSGCLETVLAFIDSRLGNDYCLEEAMCLALLARGCVEEDPLRRPSINDALKALSSIF